MGTQSHYLLHEDAMEHQDQPEQNYKNANDQQFNFKYFYQTIKIENKQKDSVTVNLKRIVLQTLVKINNTEKLYELYSHVEKELAETKWDVLGWWKAATTEDGGLFVPKGHVVSAVPNTAAAILRPLQKFIFI